MDHDYDSAKEEGCFNYNCCCVVDGVAGEERERGKSFDIVRCWSGICQRDPQGCSGLCAWYRAVPETLINALA